MEKQYVVITGRRNAGKSSLINVLTGQHISIVSDTPGTTTDPVKKSFEIPGFAPVIFIDTAGIDDEGELGGQRIKKTEAAVRQADCALLIITGNHFGPEEEQLVEQFHSVGLPFIIIHNKSDILPLNRDLQKKLEQKYKVPVLSFSTTQHPATDQLFGLIKTVVGKKKNTSLIGDILKKNDIVLLITPIDSEAPAGRIILPQVQMIREILDNECVCIVLQPEELSPFISKTGITPQLVITDSQVFKQVAGLIPPAWPLTSFSIILARHRGDFREYIRGTRQIEKLTDGDKILMLESCSHHTSCEDIGRHKIPALLRKYTGKQLTFDFISGLDHIENPVSGYSLVIQCGGCMITPTQLKNRLIPFIQAGIPVCNYGMVIAYISGIFKRAIAPLENKKEAE